MNDFWNKTKALIQCELTLKPNICTYNFSKKLNPIRKLLSMSGQVSNHTNTTLMIFSFPDNHYNIIFMEGEIFTVDEILISDFRNVPSQWLKVVTNCLPSQLTSRKVMLMVTHFIQTFLWMYFPFICFRNEILVLIMPWWHLNVCLK